LLRVFEFLQIPIPADTRMQHLVGPIVVLEQSREPVSGSLADFPFETFPRKGNGGYNIFRKAVPSRCSPSRMSASAALPKLRRIS